jgi:serine/threonine-protein kinase
MPSIGDLLAGRYRIDARLGAGGMGTVWRAHDQQLDRDVALKILGSSFAGDPVLAARFDREARALAAVASPHVVAIHDVVARPGADLFIVMEICPDGSLGDRLDRAGRLPVDVALPLLADAAEGLAALHARGILHRDVTPRNVLISGGRAKLGDLGVAREGTPEERLPRSDLTAPGTTVGTLAYLAPELLESVPPSRASDVYGLGAVAYRTLTGALPHAAGSIAELVLDGRRPVEPLASRAPGVGPALGGLVAQALDARPAARPSAAELAAGLRSFAHSTGIDAGNAAGVSDGQSSRTSRSAVTVSSAPTRSAIPARAGPVSRTDRSRAATPIPPRPGGASDRYRGPSLWSVEILLIAAVAAVVLLVLVALAGAFGGVFAAGPIAPPG